MTCLRRLILINLVVWLSACSGSGSPSPTPLPPPVQTNIITITAAGASPRNVTVMLGARLLFVNNDNRSHNMTSDPHPEHDACPELNQVGFLLPGQSRETGNFVQTRTCGFHDHDDPDFLTLHGQVNIQ